MDYSTGVREIHPAYNIEHSGCRATNDARMGEGVAHRVCGRLEEIVGRTPLRPTSPAPPKAKAERRRRAVGQTSPPETTRFAPVVYDAWSGSTPVMIG